MKNLVIVESPAKAKTLEKFLGTDFKVVSSYGHIADLPSKDIGINLETFEPNYIVSDDKKKVVKDLQTLAAKSKTIWLASDEDREGEAIAWHLAQQLKLNDSNTKRIVFNSITKSAVLDAIANPRTINYNLVNAQQARRILDRLVGYELSPVLWKKVRRGLSAGRVQSVAVRLIVEREREIENYNSITTYKVSAEFKTKEGKSFKANLSEAFTTEEEAYDFIQKNISAEFKISDIQVKLLKRHPSAPFTTSTLQQEASRKLGFSVSKTMMLAQRLYESGLITYMRTDSKNLSGEAINNAKTSIEKLFGKKYSKVRKYSTKSKGAQEAHEAIRPTDMMVEKITRDADQARLYELIWKRTIASQMSDAEVESTNLKISGSTFNQQYKAYGEVITFDGFLKVYLESTDEDAEDEEQKGLLPPLKVNDAISYKSVTATQRFSKPSARYTEASLIKQLEKLGIGRPSTYAPTISTIQSREYVEKGTFEGIERPYTRIQLKNGKTETRAVNEIVGSNKNKLVPTHIGKIVNDFLVKNFQSILDYNFTAKVEDAFDEIASGEKQWQEMLKSFYKDFHPNVIYVNETAERQNSERQLGIDPSTGKPVLVRLGKFGPIAQIGAQDDEEVRYTSLLSRQSLDNITLEEALDLFSLPRQLGNYKEFPVEVNSGRFGPYVRYNEKFYSIPSSEDLFEIRLKRAIEIIIEKEKADAPIATYNELEVTKGKGRFGPFIKWNNLFINVNKKYDFDNLSKSDIEELIIAKIKKEEEKIVKVWEEEDIRIEKSRWKRHNIIQGKKKVELSKDINVEDITLKQVKEYLK